MANELPPVTDCEEDLSDLCPDPAEKCYSVKEALPVCSSLSPASSLKSSDCARLDNTYDISLQASVVPAVGGSMQLSVCNASLYTVGSWIEFVDGVGAGSKFQIISINAIENYVTVRNSCVDGETAIDSNASPGSTFQANSRFVVVGSIKCQTSSELAEEIQALFPEFDEICLDGIAARGPVEEVALLGVLTSSDCEGGAGAPQPCLRKALTTECKDGSLKLGNVDETTADDDTLVPLFADVNNKIVSGTVTPDIFEWILQTPEAIETWTSANVPALAQFDDDHTLSNPPDDATYALVRIHLHVDDNPAGNISVKFGNHSPISSFSSWGESYATTVHPAKITDGKINYTLIGTDGNPMNFSGTTEVRLEVVGYKKITEL